MKLWLGTIFVGVVFVLAFDFTTRHEKDLNRKLGAVITSKLLDFPSLKEKMLIDFFRISRSIVISLSSMRKRAFLHSKSFIFGVPCLGKLFA